MDSVFVIADDLTGANDTGLQYAKEGWPVSIQLTHSCSPPQQQGVTVVDTETRELSGEMAGRAIGAWMHRWPLHTADCVYKKVDSTLRGNIGAEVGRLLQTGYFSSAVIAPAYPQSGRTTVNGIHYVHGVALEDTEYLPAGGHRTSRLAAVVQRQLDIPVLALTGDQVADAAVWQQLGRGGHSQPLVIAPDVRNAADLDHIERNAQYLPGKILWVGSAGLAQTLASKAPCSPRTTAPLPVLPLCTSAAIVAGSLSAVTRKQLQIVEEFLECSVMRFSPEQLQDRAAVRNGVHRWDGRTVPVLTTEERRSTQTSSHRADQVAQGLGYAAEILVKERGVGGLFITGGETAVYVCRQLGVRELFILDEVEEGIPYCAANPHQLHLVTKAGGFGSEQAMVRGLSRMLKGDSREL